MRNGARVAVVIPALNEEPSIGKVLAEIPEWVDQVIVADNGSTDNTCAVAHDAGATVVVAERRGYGSACLRGIAALPPCDVVVFVDADYSDHPEQMDRLVDPIANDEADLVIGSRVLGRHEPGALTPQQRFGNWLACRLMRLFWRTAFTDLGPFRAIRCTTLTALGMADPNYGWTVEMQIKAALHGARSIEAPVDYRKRIGRSKVSGTIRGVVGAGYKILSTIFLSAVRYYLGLIPQPRRRRLIVVTRYPEPGQTKTRLIPALGETGAANLQRAMSEHTVHTAGEVSGAEVEIRYAGGDAERMAKWLGEGHRYTDQGGGDLGEKMLRAFRDAAEQGVEQTVIVGVDCPEITPEIAAAAFTSLNDADAVFGPATDGGYYLIGLASALPDSQRAALFDGVEWGTESVLADTLARAKNAGVKAKLLAPLCDVDRPEDIARWESVRDPESRPALSVVIPALNEAAHLPGAIQSLQTNAELEIIVVDGGSTDGTPELAASGGATVVSSEPGRARQMNRGAAFATGRYLLFLHADTELPHDFAREVETCLTDETVALGAFAFATDDARASMRVIAFGTNIRSKVFKRPYGDQGLFIRRETFRTIGGFPALPIMEDVELVRRAARHGRICTSSRSATTSARRWRHLGPWRTVLYNQLVIVGYRLGVAPERLAKFYQGRGRRDPQP